MNQIKYKKDTDLFSLKLVSLKKQAFKVLAIDVRYFAMSKFFGSLIHKKIFGLIWLVVFKLG